MSIPEIVRGRPDVALVGGGFIGPVHAEALRRIGADIVGLLGSSAERARPLADRLGIPRVYDDLADLLADPTVQAVHVASPNAAHFEQARRILESGRHVVCEKPLATTAAETRTLRALARSRPQQVAAVNYNIRFYPLVREMKARVERGDVGRVLSINGSYTQDWLLRPDDYNWRVEPDGGTNLRAVADIGTHWMDSAQYVVGDRIRSVFADLAIFHPKRERPNGPSETFNESSRPAARTPVNVTTEDYGAILFRTDAAARGAFHVSQAFAGHKNRLLLEIAGTDGALAWNSEQPEHLWIGRRGEANQLLVRDPALLSAPAAALSCYPGGHAEGFPDTFTRLAAEVYRWVDAARPARQIFPRLRTATAKSRSARRSCAALANRPGST